ncbi:MAG TPA: signal peptidase II, partial [Jatrophihabitans sp.]
IAIVLRAARRLTSPGWALALGLVLGGAMGNLVDRLFRAPSPGKGHVVDWISVLASDGHVWPIFNLADSSIMTGAALAVLLSLRGVEFNSPPDQHSTPDDRPADKQRPAAVTDEQHPAGEPAALPEDSAAERRSHD